MRAGDNSGMTVDANAFKNCKNLKRISVYGRVTLQKGSLNKCKNVTITLKNKAAANHFKTTGKLGCKSAKVQIKKKYYKKLTAKRKKVLKKTVKKGTGKSLIIKH